MRKWFSIPSFPDYELSVGGEFGVTIRRVTPSRGTRPGKVLSIGVGKRGYVTVCVSRDKKAYREGYTQKSLANRFAVTEGAVWHLLSGRTWKRAA